MTPSDEFRKAATAAFLEFQAELDGAVVAELRSVIEGDGSAEAALERLKAPSSTWTYLVNDEQFSWGMSFLQQTRNLGQSAPRCSTSDRW